MTSIVLRPQKLDENKRSDKKNKNQKAPKMTEFKVKAKRRRRDRTDGQTTGRATYRRAKKRVSHSPAAFAVRRSRARREMALIGRAFYISSRHYNSCMSLTIWDAVCGIIRSWSTVWGGSLFSFIWEWVDVSGGAFLRMPVTYGPCVAAAAPVVPYGGVFGPCCVSP